MSDNTHFCALNLRLSNERARLAAATKPAEISARKVIVAQIEREIAAEIAFCYPEPGVEMTDEELLKALES